MRRSLGGGLGGVLMVGIDLTMLIYVIVLYCVEL